MVTTHQFVSAIADGGDATLVRPSNWNDEHAVYRTLTADVALPDDGFGYVLGPFDCGAFTIDCGSGMLEIG